MSPRVLPRTRPAVRWLRALAVASHWVGRGAQNCNHLQARAAHVQEDGGIEIALRSNDIP